MWGTNSQDGVHERQFFRRRRVEAEFKRRLSTYQPKALLLKPNRLMVYELKMVLWQCLGEKMTAACFSQGMAGQPCVLTDRYIVSHFFFFFFFLSFQSFFLCSKYRLVNTSSWMLRMAFKITTLGRNVEKKKNYIVKKNHRQGRQICTKSHRLAHFDIIFSSSQHGKEKENTTKLHICSWIHTIRHAC